MSASANVTAIVLGRAGTMQKPLRPGCYGARVTSVSADARVCVVDGRHCGNGSSLPPRGVGASIQLAAGRFFVAVLVMLTVMPVTAYDSRGGNCNDASGRSEVPHATGTFGCQSLEKVCMLTGLRSITLGMLSLTSGREFSQGLEKSCLPADLQSLTPGCGFCRCVEKVSPPTDLRCFTLGMQSVPCGRKFSQCVEKANLPTDLRCVTLGMQSVTFGREFSQSLEKSNLPAGLQSLTSGCGFC